MLYCRQCLKSKTKYSVMKVKKKFIVFPGQLGFVVYGLGAGVNFCKFRNQPLADFLSELEEKLLKIRDRLNLDFEKLDIFNLNKPSNQVIIRRFLETASWAYALCVELVPFQRDCVHGLTNPLRSLYLEKLEEIQVKCFAAAHIFGNPDQQIVGLRGLLTDFELNGGISPKGGVGNGFYTSLLDYFLGYFIHPKREPVLYQRFGELIEGLATLAKKKYPRICGRLAISIREKITSTDFGFGNTHVSSTAETELLAKLRMISDSLESTKLEKIG